jgi:hypothetical protein
MSWNIQQLQLYQGEIHCFSCGLQQEILHPALQRAVNRLARKQGAENWLQVRCNASLSLPATVTSIHEQSITSFRHAPDFDLVLFTLGKDQPLETALFAKLSYCRMLLRPGGTVVLVLPETGVQSLFPCFSNIISFHKISCEAAALRRTGYIKVAEKYVQGQGRIVYGQRPERFIKV